MEENKMREIEIEKVVLNCGATEDKLDKSMKLLRMITNRKIKKSISTRRIPSFGVKPGLETGCMVTLRGEPAVELLKKLLEGVRNQIKRKTIKANHFSFGIPEYIEVPSLEYSREVGILGFEVTVVFKRKGKRTGLKKIKRGKIPEKQSVKQEEIIRFLQDKLGVEII